MRLCARKLRQDRVPDRRDRGGMTNEGSTETRLSPFPGRGATQAWAWYRGRIRQREGGSDRPACRGYRHCVCRGTCPLSARFPPFHPAARNYTGSRKHHRPGRCQLVAWQHDYRTAKGMTASSTPFIRQRGGLLFLAKRGIFAAFPDGLPRQQTDVVWGGRVARWDHTPRGTVGRGPVT
jgi:hypothetical protein